ncbi:MAG: DUF4167 domain-containing protein [Candidatus Puniceispirillales bacterium]
MRQSGKNNRQRGRGRRNGNGQINRNTTLDSNGPDVRLRGNALQLHEKYVSLGNDAAASGERISAEAYYQHADHYFRVHSAIVSAHEERRNGHAENGSAADTPAEASADDAAETTAAPAEANGHNGDASAEDTETKADAADIVADGGDADDEVSQHAG